MNYIKFSILIIFSLFLIFDQVLTEDNKSTGEKSVLEELKNDDNKSEINERNFVEHSLVGDIEKLIKVAEILETVGQKVIPAILTSNRDSAAIETDVNLEPTVLGSKGIHDGLFHIREFKKNVDKLKNQK